MRCLLLIDPIGRVVVADVDSGARFVFDDVPTPGGAEGAAPSQSQSQARTAAWSTVGQWTAWSLASEDFDGVQEIRVHHEGSVTNEVVSSALTAFYLYPSPCGRRLSHLSPGPLGLELAVSDVYTGELQVIERGQPLFWAWSADATRIAVHVGDRVLIVPVDGGAPTVITETAGSFVAPWWTPEGSVLYVEEGRIRSYGPDGVVIDLPVDAQTGRFAPDPDGRRIAVVERVDGVPSLVVVDLLTGDRHVVVEAERTAAFFWSPDGRRLAVLVLAGRREFCWVVTDGVDTVRLSPFRPGTAWLREVLPFFEQYAHSHAVWSPDGMALVAPALDADGSTEAIVQHASGAGTPTHLAGARLAWWAAD